MIIVIKLIGILKTVTEDRVFKDLRISCFRKLSKEYLFFTYNFLFNTHVIFSSTELTRQRWDLWRPITLQIKSMQTFYSFIAFFWAISKFLNVYFSMICLKLKWFYNPSRILQLSEFVWTLRSSVWVVFNNFLLIDATDIRKSSDQMRLFFAVSLYPFSFFTNTSFTVKFFVVTPKEYFPKQTLFWSIYLNSLCLSIKHICFWHFSFKISQEYSKYSNIPLNCPDIKLFYFNIIHLDETN